MNFEDLFRKNNRKQLYFKKVARRECRGWISPPKCEDLKADWNEKTTKHAKYTKKSWGSAACAWNPLTLTLRYGKPSR
jgi:hypothetical protein